jgi:hypothetical protein
MVKKRAFILGLAALVAGAMGVQAYASLQEQAQAAGDVQPISWERWLLVKSKAEENDAAGNLVAALQYYLEYVRQAEGLGSAVRVAWGKNNAAYMIIKMHMQDASVELAPARKMLEEGLALAEATEDCRRVMTANLEYVKANLR